MWFCKVIHKLYTYPLWITFSVFPRLHMSYPHIHRPYYYYKIINTLRVFIILVNAYFVTCSFVPRKLLHIKIVFYEKFFYPNTLDKQSFWFYNESCQSGLFVNDKPSLHSLAWKEELGCTHVINPNGFKNSIIG